MKIARRILLSIIALLVAAGGVLSVYAGISAAPVVKPGGNLVSSPNIANIVSDGMTYPIKALESIKTAISAPKETLPSVGDRETLLKLLMDRGAFYDSSTMNGKSRDVMEDGAVVEYSATAGVGADYAAPESSHSRTNEQVEGVSEGDIVKTDGEYIYALSGEILRIIRAEGAEMRVVSEIKPEGIWGAEFYLLGDRLALAGSAHVQMDIMPAADAETERAVSPAADIAWNGYWGNNFTVLLVYDITDRGSPKEIRRVEMDGYSLATRVVGDTVYLVTNKNVWAVPYENADSPAIMPYCRDSAADGELAPFDMDRIYYIPETNDCNYLLVGAIDVTSDEPFEPTAYLGAGSTLYMNLNAIYIAKPDYRDWNKQTTDILRFDIEGTNITYSGMGTVEGTPINQYCMDEYNGYFRIATIDWSSGSYITVLDSGMKVTGRAGPLAPGENLQSVRFMGDMGYAVTFENTDPLFTVDLADPYNPKVLGELKIPGFSQYLHPVGDGLLLGIGRDTQEIYTKDANGVEEIVGFRDVGLKVSLFDVSDPANPIEIDKLSLGEGYAEISYNPRALMADRSRSLYGFTLERWSNMSSYAAMLLKVEGNRLSVAAELSDGGKDIWYSGRLCYIGNTLYLVGQGGVISYAYDTFEYLNKLAF